MRVVEFNDGLGRILSAARSRKHILTLSILKPTVKNSGSFLGQKQLPAGSFRLAIRVEDVAFIKIDVAALQSAKPLPVATAIYHSKFAMHIFFI